MIFQLRTDNHIEGNEALSERVRTEVEGALLPQHADQLRRVEVYLQDMNSHKGGIGIQCNIEVHLAGYQAIVTHDNATNIDEAVSGAIDKMTRTIDRTLGRLQDRHGRVSMSGEET